MFDLCETVHQTTGNNRVIVSLSNGKTIFSDAILGKKSWWKRLKDYINSDENLRITTIRYQIGNDVTQFKNDAKFYYLINRQEGNIGESAVTSIRIGFSDDGKKIVGLNFMGNQKSHFEIAFSRGGFGVINNS